MMQAEKIKYDLPNMLGCILSTLPKLFSLSYLGLLTPKILRDPLWAAGYFRQPLTYPDVTIFISDFLCIIS
jgi:hypothetical protein